jgi:NAD(P)-dependent dehydrogenase (short-subunit alcohol dehydrogenase family)
MPGRQLRRPHGWLPPLGRAGQVSDVVDGVLFLESSPYITGEILHIDGGQIAGRSEPL